MAKDNVTRAKKVATERPYAWVILVATFMSAAFAFGGAKAFGVFYVEFLEVYGSGSGSTAWIASVSMGLMLGCGMGCSWLCQMFSVRKVVIFGGLLAAFGHLVSAYIDRMEWLYLTYGVLTGLGRGMCFTPSLMMVNSYFVHRRAFANGVFASGSGVGSFIFPFLTRGLLDSYGLDGALLIFTGITLNICVCGALMRPLEEQSQVHYADKELSGTLEEEKSLSLEVKYNTENGNTVLKNTYTDDFVTASEKETSRSFVQESNYSEIEKEALVVVNPQEIENGPLLETGIKENTSQKVDLTLKKQVSFNKDEIQKPVDSPQNVQTEDNFYSMDTKANVSTNTKLAPQRHSKRDTEQTEKKTRTCGDFCLARVKSPHVDFSILTYPVFLIFELAFLLITTAYLTHFIMLPAHAVHLGFSKTKADLLLSIIGISDIIGRTFLGWFSDIRLISREKLSALVAFLGGLSAILVTFSSDFAVLCAYAVCVGILPGAGSVIAFVLMTERIGSRMGPGVLGVHASLFALPALLGPPVAGWIKDWTGSWNVSFVLVGVCMLTACVTTLFIGPAVHKIVKKREYMKHNVDIT